MFYIYIIDHLGKYKKVWKLYEPCLYFETASQALMAIRERAKNDKMDIEDYRIVWFNEPKDVSILVTSIYYPEEEKIRSIYGCR